MSDKADRIWEIRKYIYDKVYQGYEREINTLWHRSVFLGAFILSITTAYGAIIGKTFEDNIAFGTFKGTQFLLCFVSLLGTIFSILWICMARASKANQEEFEMRLTALGKKLEISCLNCTDDIEDEAFFDETGTGPNILGEVDALKFKKYAQWCHETNTRFFSLGGGSFSVSKINSMIGYVFFFTFLPLFAFHGMVFVCTFGANICANAIKVNFEVDYRHLNLFVKNGVSFFEHTCGVFSSARCFTIMLCIAIELMLVVGLWFLLKKLLHSNHLNHR